MDAVEAVGDETIIPAESVKTVVYLSKSALDTLPHLKKYLQAAMQANAKRVVVTLYHGRRVSRVEHGQVKIRSTYTGPEGELLDELQYYAVLRTSVYVLPEGVK